MKKNKIFLTIAGVLICFTFLITGSILAQDTETDKDKNEKTENSEFTGEFQVGYRAVDLSDTSVENKYKEDINLEKGPRLFNFLLHYTPKGDMNKWFDNMNIRMYNLGGDPFETIGIDVVKYGLYQFRFDHKKSSYFFADNLKEGDLHTFDFDRVMNSGRLKVWLAKNAHFYLDFLHYTKKGNSITSYDIEREEFEFEKPIDEKSNDVTIGIDFSHRLFAIALEEKFVDYKNANSLYLPGYNEGGAFYPTSLYYFNLNQAYDMKGNTHTAKLTLTPFKNLLIHGNAMINIDKTDVTYSENAKGTGYIGNSFEYNYTGTGKFDVRIYTYNADLTYILSNKFALIGAARYDKYDRKKAEFTVGTETEDPFLKYESGSVEGGLQFQPSSKIGITLGYRYEERDIKVPDDEPKIEEDNTTTTAKGVFGNLKVNLFKNLDLTVDYQRGDNEHNYTLLSPSTSNRFKILARYNLKQFFADASYFVTRSTTEAGDDNGDTQPWSATQKQTRFRLGYQGKQLVLWTGYTSNYVTREGERVIYFPPNFGSGGSGSFDWDIFFTGKSRLFDAFLSYNIVRPLGIGGYFNSYRNEGSWELSRYMIKAFVKYEFAGGILSEIGYRYVDYKEKIEGLNNYKANIIEFSLGYRW